MDAFEFIEKELKERKKILSNTLVQGQWTELDTVNYTTGQVRGLEAALRIVNEAKEKYGEE